jgi:ferric-dicitrate binding protein FerR (iron transport regulator)
MDPALRRWVSEVASAERAARPELDFERQRERFLRHAEGRRRVRSKGWLALAAAVAAVLALALRAWLPAPELRFEAGGEPGRAGERLVAPERAPLPIEFSDGSRLTLDRAARLEVMELGARGARLLLERGTLQANVTHAERTRWSFAAGPFHLEVVGTRFELGWEPSTQSFHLVLTEGSVRLNGPNLQPGCVVAAGDEVRLSLDGASARGRCVIAEAAPPVAPVRGRQPRLAARPSPAGASSPHEPNTLPPGPRWKPEASTPCARARAPPS